MRAAEGEGGAGLAVESGVATDGINAQRKKRAVKFVSYSKYI